MSIQFRSRAILVVFLMALTTNIFAISSGCFYGRPDGVSYNTVWHDAQWSYYDVNSSFDTAYMVTVVDGPKPGQRNDNFPAGAGAEVTHYLNEPLDGSYDIEGGIWLDDGAPYTWADCWTTADVSNTSYSGGICSRSVGVEQVPSSLFGITIPNSVVEQVEQILLAVWVDHENARVEKTYYGSVVESVERGFFAVSASDAVQAAVVHLADAVIPDSIAVSDSYVQGKVEADTGWVCDMAPKSATQYAAMKSGIQGASNQPYSLIYFNYQHWAAARQI